MYRYRHSLQRLRHLEVTQESDLTLSRLKVAELQSNLCIGEEYASMLTWVYDMLQYRRVNKV